jgi:hypothetical protein
VSRAFPRWQPKPSTPFADGAELWIALRGAPGVSAVPSDLKRNGMTLAMGLRSKANDMRQTGTATKAALEFVAVLAAFAAVNVLSALFQKPITWNNGQGWDGVEYYKVASEIADGQPLSAEGPYVYRVLVPFLAAHLNPEDLLAGFLTVGVISNLAATILLLVWLRRYLSDPRVRVLLVFLFIAQWHGPVRFIFFYRAYPDPLLFVALLSGLILIDLVGRRPMAAVIGLSLAVALGVLVREAALVLAFSFLFVGNPLPLRSGDRGSWFRPHLLLPLAAGIASFATAHAIAVQTGDYSFLVGAYWWAYTKELPAYLQAWFVAFGPVLILALFDWRRVRQFLADHQALLVYLVAFAVLAWIGGSDTERYLYWSMPVVFVPLGMALEARWTELASPWLVSVLAIAQAISQRLFWLIPDYPGILQSRFPFLTPLGSHVPYLDLYSEHGERIVEALSLAEYSLLAIVLLVWLSRRARLRHS